MLYNINESPKKVIEWIVFTAQFVFAVLPATILISTICGTSLAAGLVSAGLGTLVFLLITGFKVPVCTSNSGATVSAVTGALLLTSTTEKNFTAVILGGVIMMSIYLIAGLIAKKYGTEWLSKIFPNYIASATVIIIGINLMKYIPTYAQINNAYSLLGICLTILTMSLTILFAIYGKGYIKHLPFFFSILFGYLICLIITFIGKVQLIDLDTLYFNEFFKIPDFAFMHINLNALSIPVILQTLIMFATVSLAAMTEHIADMTAVSKVVNDDLVKKYLHRTLIGDGVSSLFGALTGAQMTTTYSEYTGTIAISKVASSKVTLSTAITLIFLGFVAPFTQFLANLPNAVFAGISIIAYGLIAVTGLESLMNSQINFSSAKERMILAAMLSCGCSGLTINAGFLSISGVALAIIIGVILNKIIR